MSISWRRVPGIVAQLEYRVKWHQTKNIIDNKTSTREFQLLSNTWPIVFRLELHISRVHAFAHWREINIQIFKTVYLKNSCTRVYEYSRIHVL